MGMRAFPKRFCPQNCPINCHFPVRLGGFIMMPITMPGDMYYTFRIQARMVLSLAYLYGWNIHDDDFETDILIVMGGSAAIGSFSQVGIKIGQAYTKKSVQKY
jgi:hypothetical protein